MAVIKSERYVNIIDTTLRNGEQTAGVVFSKHEKIRITKMLDEIGIPEIEIGTPSLGAAEREIIKEIVKDSFNSKLFVYCEAEPENIEYAVQCGAENVIINISTSDIHLKEKYKKTKTWVINKLKETIRVARQNNLNFIVSAEDATRTDLGFLL